MLYKTRHCVQYAHQKIAFEIMTDPIRSKVISWNSKRACVYLVRGDGS